MTMLELICKNITYLDSWGQDRLFEVLCESLQEAGDGVIDCSNLELHLVTSLYKGARLDLIQNGTLESANQEFAEEYKELTGDDAPEDKKIQPKMGLLELAKRNPLVGSYQIYNPDSFNLEKFEGMVAEMYSSPKDISDKEEPKPINRSTIKIRDRGRLKREWEETGQKLKVVKLCKELGGLGLKDAKEYCEKYIFKS